MDERSSQIQQFYNNQNVLITGGTGFLGKLLIEKLLRSTNCKCVYLLIREKKGKSIQQRLNQLFDSVLFDRLRDECPNFKERICGIYGDCILNNFGLTQSDELVLIETINIVFHVAATIRFNEYLKTAFLINVRATGDMIKLCKKMEHLKSFVHVSTAYSHCYRERIDECFYDIPIDYKEISILLDNINDNDINGLTNQIIDKWPNTYTFTKALAEDLIRNETLNQHLPIGIFRPSIVISTYKEPIDGWSDNLYGPNGLTASCITGLLRTILLDDNAITDLIPADYCINSLIAVAWDIATMIKNRNYHQLSTPPPIYNYVSSPENPLTWQEFACLGLMNNAKYPTINMQWQPTHKSTVNKYFHRFYDIVLHLIPAILFDAIYILCLKQPKMLKTYKYTNRLTTVLAYFSLRTWQFSNNNTKQLLTKLNCKDKELFDFNIIHLSWLIYFRTYIKGIRIYLLNDPLDTLDDAKQKLWWYKKMHLFFKFLLNLLVFFIIYYLFTNIFY